MKQKILNFLLITIIFIFNKVKCEFEVPDALIEVFDPKGIKISIPDQEGIKLFAIHAKINEEMNGREAGTFSRDITKAKNGRWTFYEPNAKLNIGDVLYYWTFVDYFDGQRKLGYAKDDQLYEVKQLINKNTNTTNNGCINTDTTVNGQKSCKGKLIYFEDFNELNSNSSIWPEVKFAGSPDYEFVIYDNNPEILILRNGFLYIKPELSDTIYGHSFVRQSMYDIGKTCTGKIGTTECIQEAGGYIILPPVVSAKLTTKTKFSFKYGIVEIRAKLPKGDWIYPQLTLNSLYEDYGANYESGQIRIAFTYGNEDLCKTLYSGCILGDSLEARNNAIRSLYNNEDWGESFHNYKIEWTPDYVKMSVDDKIIGTIYPPTGGFINDNALKLNSKNKWHTGSKFAPFDKEMFISVGVGVGGHNYPNSLSNVEKPWKNNDPLAQKNFYRARNKWYQSWDGYSTLIVDYIKVRAL